ncbi:MAG: hypothetical protein RL702_909 [Pseudomonadota bacterium]|jgi:ankyrin repeat protein|nr:ankyrin repeat domain-containing protein [Novosphingobium sp.]HOA50045.1 ankyrin repeat domain-containing protein [Novosphingobium sp.]HPB21274.1 ankyrin repeat domain-containing protein [Novosphingobium sp.]HPZ45431.1 ankyrin repeat domain-containing protein [Novosphingobium sp.]HQE00114.1 ankyrin repeat domain-containing protein [Novosphingobium sp.]
MTVPRFRLTMLALTPLIAAGLVWSAPAAAQFSQSYKFLEAVKKREGTEVTDMLAEPGTTIVNTRDVTTGETALHLVTARRDLTWMQFLVAKGANVNLKDVKGVTPLVLACNLGFTEGAEFLVGKGARVDESNSSGETPLITSVHNRNVALVRVLLKAGANPDRADNSGRTARDYAALDKGGTLLAEIESAMKARAAAQTLKPNYGPKL